MNKQTGNPFILALKAYNLTVKIHHHSAYQIVLSNDIAYQKFGNIDVLQTIEEPKSSIQSHEVLVKVKAVSINPMDWKIRNGEMKLMSGSKFPKHIGVDFAGIIEDAGHSNFKKGDEVFGVVKNAMKDSALAQFVAVPATHLWKNPQTFPLLKLPLY